MTLLCDYGSGHAQGHGSSTVVVGEICHQIQYSCEQLNTKEIRKGGTNCQKKAQDF
jgi:hypothetical protein